MPTRPSCGRASLAELGEDYTPSIEQLARFQKAGRAVRSGWGQRCGSQHQRAVGSGRYASSRCVSA